MKARPSPLSSAKHTENDPFAHLPPYTPPTKGLVSHLPSALVPFAELMRLHKPAGYYAFYFPHLFGTFIAAVLSSSVPSVSSLAYVCAIHGLGNLFLRGAACTWNDTLDAPLDRQVGRCRHRPVARGAVSPNTAHIFTIAQTAVWILTLSWLPRECDVPAALFAAIMAVYPLCKRVTNFPQVVLGFSLALGQSVGMASLGVDPFPPTSPKVRLALACVYFSNVVNAIIYDTVYAHQDLQDDLKAGVMSMAVACAGQTKKVLSVLGMAEIALLASTGCLLGLGAWFWGAAVGGTAIVLGWMIVTVRLEEAEDCWRWFKWCIWFIGGTLCLGLLGEYAMRL
ncbi:MAG: Para-hydroxybenzoate--polyprenyltransferase, mitochondrial precursor (PHB:polyprenyltransferase) [Alectoria sarmentosa]|nr:MAG: Para-hydroxybenzoate--polyprenyltransferase, mitochondrial precursor (PHB:polyprenyltransferase) [Alectoria sarmentosa]